MEHQQVDVMETSRSNNNYPNAIDSGTSTSSNGGWAVDGSIDQCGRNVLPVVDDGIGIISSSTVSDGHRQGRRQGQEEQQLSRQPQQQQ